MLDDIPFKNKTKYVVERKVDGDKTLFVKKDGDGFFKSDVDVDERVASVSVDEDFVAEGFAVDGKFYVSDLVSFDGESFVDKPWPQRYKVLKNEFRWNSAIKINRPLVVTDKNSMREALELFNMLPYSEGVLVRPYDSLYGDEKVFVRGEK